jgi:hypothetical protein
MTSGITYQSEYDRSGKLGELELAGGLENTAESEPMVEVMPALPVDDK